MVFPEPEHPRRVISPLLANIACMVSNRRNAAPALPGSVIDMRMTWSPCASTWETLQEGRACAEPAANRLALQIGKTHHSHAVRAEGKSFRLWLPHVSTMGQYRYPHLSEDSLASKTLITPSNKAVKRHTAEVPKVVRQHGCTANRSYHRSESEDSRLASTIGLVLPAKPSASWTADV